MQTDVQTMGAQRPDCLCACGVCGLPVLEGQRYVLARYEVDGLEWCRYVHEECRDGVVVLRW